MKVNFSRDLTGVLVIILLCVLLICVILVSLQLCDIQSVQTDKLF